MIAVILATLGVSALLALGAMSSRRRGRDDGVTSFRRHLDALSPAARSTVTQRTRRD
jgi:hypothetical protein